MHKRTSGSHIFVTESARKPEKIGLVANRVCRAEIGKLQGVGDGEISDGVVGGVGVDRNCCLSRSRKSGWIVG